MYFAIALLFGTLQVFAGPELPPCKSTQAEIDSWWPKETTETTETLKVPSIKRDRALRMLKELFHPSEIEVKKLRASLKNEKGVMTWLKAIGKECATDRVRLARVLINSTQDDPKFKDEVSAAIKDSLRTNRFPTLLNVMIDTVIAEYALKHLWQGKGEVLAKVERLHKDLKSAAEDWRKRFGDSFAENAKPSAKALAGIESEIEIYERSEAALRRLVGEF